jgi:hypothetical protein
MDYKFEIKPSDTIPAKHWLIIKREEKTEGFSMSKTELNRLRIAIEIYLSQED